MKDYWSEIKRVPFPKYNLTKDNLSLLDSYKDLLIKCSKVDMEDNNILMEALNSFYNSLSAKERKLYYSWYKYNSVIINPNIVAATEIIDMITKTEIGFENIFLSEDGMKFYIKFDGDDANANNPDSAISKMINILDSSYKKMPYKISNPEEGKV